MSSEAQSAQTWIEHLDIISSVLSEVEPADLDSAFNLGSETCYRTCLFRLVERPVVSVVR